MHCRKDKAIGNGSDGLPRCSMFIYLFILILKKGAACKSDALSNIARSSSLFCRLVNFIQTWSQSFFAFIKYHHAFVDAFAHFFLLLQRQVIHISAFLTTTAIIGSSTFGTLNK